MVAEAQSGTNNEIVAISLEEDGPPETLLTTPELELNIVVSTDRRWIAYEVWSTDDPQVYVRPFPSLAGERHRISPVGGGQPVWSRTGDELFFISMTGSMMAARVRRDPAFRVKEITELFPTGRLPGRGGRSYNLSTIDERFLVSV